MGRPKTVQICAYFPYPTRRLFDAAKREARRQVSAAIQHGAMVKQPCVVCGARQSEGHHDDYSRPLDVIWLCRRHHVARHKELRKAVAIATTQPTPSRAIREYHNVLSRPDVAKPLILEAASLIHQAMTNQGLNENRFASQLGVSRQHLNSVFGGGIRTLRSLATLADALGYEAHFHLTKKSEKEVAA